MCIRDSTSIRRELGRAPSLSQVADDLTPHLTEMMSFAPYQMSPDVPRTQHAAFHHPTADHPAADHHQPQPNVVKEIRL